MQSSNSEEAEDFLSLDNKHLVLGTICAGAVVAALLIPATRKRICQLFSCGKDAPALKLHVKCRNQDYAFGQKRFPVPDDKVSWNVEYSEYEPNNFIAPSVLKAVGVWADAEIVKGEKQFQFNSDNDGGVDRKSMDGEYSLDEHGCPINPRGRTGMSNRGLLGKWGPNHAADPMVTRWKRDESGAKVKGASGRPILQFVAIRRKDTRELAIPGGMRDSGEEIGTTLLREFGEEALDSIGCQNPTDQHAKLQQLKEIFGKCDYKVIYRGYVDDPRNTDNAWMETVAVNYHDETGDHLGQLTLTAGDDASHVYWQDIESTLQLYASHSDFIARLVRERGAHW